ncbi:YeeE/YedE family protein [Kocuria sp. cx-455]|uniref:YeeE/YedE thiosulfate transporter family protein n=1 Tax=unclassified Candidatus Sulfotelmatobacter TaxID=2635724 RepID=UPI001687E2E6|nr:MULTISPECIES: YeeE/YedE thiosulfate transporter family protein [unclassified Candidatus Sulfotelmatobacter]MBD2763136.1 YeeE/YedE family protein [Kocuria sp. cx-116]MBD2765888.1 YeeE/YedE family protein [Kocuria sp. cx-455]
MILTGLVVGAVLGIVMQRGRFCVTGMLRDIFLQKSWRTFAALLIVISVHAIGLAALTSLGVIAPEYSTFAPAAVIIGGFMFGIGIILAGGCASGTWYRSGEGLVGSWVALAMYALSASAMKGGMLDGFNSWMTSWDTGLTTVPAALGISPWIFAIALAVFTGIMVRRFMIREASSPKPARLNNRPAWKRPLHVYNAAWMIGLLGVIAWPLSAATGRNSGLGITTPSAHTLDFITTGDSKFMNWGTLLVLGLLVGSFIAAKATGEFRIRVADAKTTVRAVAGGVLMGVGAALAGGCTVGNGMVETSLFSFQGWIALLFIALGVGAGTKLWLKPSAAQPAARAQDTETYSTSESLDHNLSNENPSGNSIDATPSKSPQSTNAFSGFAAAPSAVMVKDPTLAPSKKLKDLGEGYYALDSLGAVCPFPLIEAKDVMKTLQSGDHLVIDFDCTQATEAIPHWAATDGHEVTDYVEKGEASWQITLKKG